MCLGPLPQILRMRNVKFTPSSTWNSTRSVLSTALTAQLLYLSLLYCILFISFFLHMHRRNKYRRRCRFYNTHAQKPGLSAQVHTEGGAVLLSLYYTKLSGKQVNIFTICNTGLGMLGRVCLTKVPCQQFHFLDTNAK